MNSSKSVCGQTLHAQHLVGSFTEFKVKVKSINQMHKIRFGFHGVVLAHHVMTLYACCTIDASKMKPGIAKDLAGSGPKFFTSWNLGVQTLYFFLAFLIDIIKFLGVLKSTRAKLTTFNGYLYNAIMFPATIFVFSGFWLLYCAHRDWVLSEELEAIFPPGLNTAIHTTILPVLFLERFLYSGDMPRPKYERAVRIATIYLVVYNIQYMWHYYTTGIWLYGIFYDITSWVFRMLVIVSSFLLFRVYLRMGYWIQDVAKLGKCV